MSEDDRAAKAARAKAMLKKRQAKKVADAGGVPSIPRVASPAPRIVSPSPASSRTFSPALPVEAAVSSPLAPVLVPIPAPPQIEKQESNVSVLFDDGPSTIGADSSWLSGLTRVDATSSPADVISPIPRHASQPPPQVHTPTPPATLEQGELHSLLHDQKQTIEALEAEKASMKASLGQLSQMENKVRQTEELLQNAHAKSEQLEGVVQQLQENAGHLSQQMKEQQGIISSLKAERDALSRSISELNATLAKTNEEMEQALRAERQNSTRLQEQVQTLDESVHEHSERVEQQQQTISLLVSEKASLTSSVESLEHTEATLQETEKRLQDELSRSAKLQVRVSQLESETETSASKISALSQSEKELADRSRDQEREIQLLNGTVHDLRTQSEDHQRRVRELEEQIESDDRAERLEETLKNTQDRADELEFQLSKLHQAHVALQTDRDQLADQLHQRTAAEADWRARHAEVQQQQSATQEQLSSVVAERDSLLSQCTALQTAIESNKNLVAELQQKLAVLASDLATNARQMKQVQAELKAANARADDAEKAQKELQAEGIGLMRSLDEMRPKIVELTNEKLLLSEKVDNLEMTIHTRDSVIVQLEHSAEELRDEKVAVERERDVLRSALESERSALQKDSTELQQAYSELQAELASVRKVVHDLEDERDKLRLVANSNVEEIRRLTESVQSQTTQLLSLRSELAERTQAQTEAQEFLSRAQAEMEALRLEQAQKDEELEHLREEAASTSELRTDSTVPQSQSLNAEMLSALKQQHALELSSAHSRVRELETAVFNAEAHAHALQRQMSVLEDELAQLRPPRPSSQNSVNQAQALPKRTAGRALDHSDELRRASFGSHRPQTSGLSPPATRSAFEGLSPEARHKRKVSLSMLKARIDSEVAASSHLPRPSSRNSRSFASPIHKPVGLPAVIEPPSEPSSTPPPHIHTGKRPVFMDESHIFWCHSCQGDLVVL